jgi:uncharacterized membrane protein
MVTSDIHNSFVSWIKVCVCVLVFLPNNVLSAFKIEISTMRKVARKLQSSLLDFRFCFLYQLIGTVILYGYTRIARFPTVKEQTQCHV